MLGRDLQKALKAAAPASADEIAALLASNGEVEVGDIEKLLATVIESARPDEIGKHKTRLAIFSQAAATVRDKRLFAIFMRSLKGADRYTRATLVPLMVAVSDVSLHVDLCELLRQPDVSLRQVAAQVLQQVAGKTALAKLDELAGEASFAGRVEAMDVAVSRAGAGAIPLVSAVLRMGTSAEKVRALKTLADKDLAAKDPARALEAIGSVLGDADEQVAIGAVVHYSSLCSEDEFFERVAPMLGSDRRAVMKACVEALRRFRSARAIQALERAFHLGPNMIREAVLASLEAIATDDVLPLLVEALDHPQMTIRMQAGEVLTRLSRTGTVDVARTVMWLLGSPDVNTRRIAAEIASSIQDQEDQFWPRMLGFILDEDWWVRERVLDALVEMVGLKLTRHMVARLDDPMESVRRFAINGLRRLKDPAALGALIRAADSDPDWLVREAAIGAIAETKDRRAIPYLVDFLNRSPDLRLAILIALVDLDAKEAAPHVAALLSGEEGDVRRAALRCLDALDDRSQLQAVAPLLHDHDRVIAKRARAIHGRWDTQPLTLELKTPRVDGSLDHLLIHLAESGGDDLVLASDRRPSMKRLGTMEALSERALEASEVESMLLPLLSAVQRRELGKLKDIDLSHEITAEELRFRANIFQQSTGLGAVFRTLRGAIPAFDGSGLPPIVRTFAELSSGLVLVGGPTGSGKSTTLATIIDHINRNQARHVLTLEDPIEVVYPQAKSLVSQREVGTHTHSFTDALRSTLREDPDVILVGEMRDLGTLSFAVSAAETGHLVFGTIHTLSAATTVERLVGAFPAGRQHYVRAMLAETLRAVMCQHLVPRKDGKGRVLAVELMINNEAISNMIRKGKDYQIPSVIQTSREQGMQLMDDSLLRLLRDGLISADEAYARANNKPDFEEFLDLPRDAMATGADDVRTGDVRTAEVRSGDVRTGDVNRTTDAVRRAAKRA